MKKIVGVLAMGLCILASCTGVRTISTGLENEAFLEFIGKPLNYEGGVSVSIDDAITFKAKVKKDYEKRPKGNVYAISTGTHNVTVSYDNRIIYKKQIFVASQETKKIVLP